MQEKITAYLFSLSKKPKTLLVLLVLAALASGYFFYNYYTAAQQLDKIRKNPQLATQQEVNDTIAKVGRLVTLPVGEQPTIATVTDVKKLRDQPFFAKAESGDKVLIYTKAKKAYLYSVRLDKILDVAPVNIGPAQGAPASPTPAPKK